MANHYMQTKLVLYVTLSGQKPIPGFYFDNANHLKVYAHKNWYVCLLLILNAKYLSMWYMNGCVKVDLVNTCK